MSYISKKKIKQDRVAAVVSHVRSKLEGRDAEVMVQFVQHCCRLIAPDDLITHSPMHWYGLLASHWRHLASCQPEQTQVRVYNPQYDQHGWISPHTVIDVVHPDRPFVLDSVRQCVLRSGWALHCMVHPGAVSLQRDAAGQVVGFTSDHEQPHALTFLHLEVDKQTDPHVLQDLEKRLNNVLACVKWVVSDWGPMRKRMEQTVHVIRDKHPQQDPSVQESIDFLDWLTCDHWTFLGCRDYTRSDEDPSKALRSVPNSGLGLLRQADSYFVQHIDQIPDRQDGQALSSCVLVAKANCRSPVHRDVYMDYISVPLWDVSGREVGERRFVGLFTSHAYNSSLQSIPLLRQKVDTILALSELGTKGHVAHDLLNVLERFPRDDLFQGEPSDLLDMALGIMQLQERRMVRLFMRQDTYGRFVSCLVFLPKKWFNTERLEKMRAFFAQQLRAEEITHCKYFSESALVRIHYTVRLRAGDPFPAYEVDDLERQLRQVVRRWQDDLCDALKAHAGEAQGNALFERYGHAFPAGYRERYAPQTAVHDIEHIEPLQGPSDLGMTFYRPLGEQADRLRFRLFHSDHPLPLSDVLPILENMGMRVLSEHTHELMLADGQAVWINDFVMTHTLGHSLNVEEARLPFQDNFYHVWTGQAENDSFNRLVLMAGLSWRDTAVLRAYAKYLRQVGFTFSVPYMQDALNRNPEIAQQLVALFKVRLDPSRRKRWKEREAAAQQAVLQALERVSNLDEDRILRRYLAMIVATVRTNYFQKDAQGNHKPSLTLKFDPMQVPELPKPWPFREIFVYSPRVEGVHLRCGELARGGIRWSDRREDMRTEIKDLMKAQRVKNAMIVPSGAKGGFVPQQLDTQAPREQMMQEVLACYQIFIQGLLDVTDNLDGERVIPPEQVVRLDGDDPYLVVAADRGTSTFSDTANGIASRYGFWLADAFASGGSSGYDHKKMGITARGAWESVKQHFRDLGLDVQTQSITVVGVGDMAGDVFGNGMLQSEHIKLVAAFNHTHIFIDPDPIPQVSYQERKRLFHMPRSAWSDYNPDHISKGGGVYARRAKSIRLSPEAQALLGVQRADWVPQELIRVILKAPVDLLWHGGIGTYVKASSESHADVGDKANDALRVDGCELACLVVGEGGNLGMTQLGRVEYARKGGLCFADFIDNAGGVNCSDREVNIKILLNACLEAGDLTLKQRDALLEDMTQDVGDLVIQDNYAQIKAINLAASRASDTLDEYVRFIGEMERLGYLDPALEYLPDEEQLAERRAQGKGLTRPEIAVLFAYSKIALKDALLQAKLPEEGVFLEELERAFPPVLRERYRDHMLQHKLRQHIIATRLSSSIINTMGITFVRRLYDETGASPFEISKAFLAAREVFDLSSLLHSIEALDNRVSTDMQQQLTIELSRLIRRVTRWFLRHRRMQLCVEDLTAQFKPRLQKLLDLLPTLLRGADRDYFASLTERLVSQGVSQQLARYFGLNGLLFSALDIIEVAECESMALADVAAAYYTLGDRLELRWLRDRIKAQPVDDHWDALARSSFRDEVDFQQRQIAVAVLRHANASSGIQARMDQFLSTHRILVKRWFDMIAALKDTPSKEFTIFSVALRELLDLAQTSLPVSPA